MKGTIIYFSKRYLHKFKIYKYKAIRLSSKNKWKFFKTPCTFKIWWQFNFNKRNSKICK